MGMYWEQNFLLNNNSGLKICFCVYIRFPVLEIKKASNIPISNGSSFLNVQIADSMEVNILGIIGPVLKCEWLLEDWQIAIYSSVSLFKCLIIAR